MLNTGGHITAMNICVVLCTRKCVCCYKMMAVVGYELSLSITI